MNRLPKTVGTTVASTVGKYIAVQLSSHNPRTNFQNPRTGFQNSRTNRDGPRPGQIYTSAASTSCGKRLKDELQIMEKEQALANIIHGTGIKLDNENVDDDLKVAYIINLLKALEEREKIGEKQILERHGLRELESAISELKKCLKVEPLKDENRKLKSQRSLQREKIASLEEKIRQNDMDMQTMWKKVKELEDGSADLMRENSQLAQENKGLMHALESAIISVNLEGHQAWEKIASLEQKIRQNDMEYQTILKRLKELEDGATELRMENSRLALENKDLKHQLESANSILIKGTERELLEEVKHLKEANDELKNKVVYIKLLDAIRRYKPRNHEPRPQKRKSEKGNGKCNPIQFAKCILRKFKKMVVMRKRGKRCSAAKPPSSSGSSKRRRTVSVCPIDEHPNKGLAYSSDRISSASSVKISIRDGRWRRESAWLQTSFRSSFYVIKSRSVTFGFRR